MRDLMEKFSVTRDWYPTFATLSKGIFQTVNISFFFTAYIYYLPYITLCGRRGGLMVSALVPGASGPCSIPCRGHGVVFLGKTLYSHSASLHPGVLMGTGELLGKPNKLRGSDLQWTSIPARTTDLQKFRFLGNFRVLG